MSNTRTENTRLVIDAHVHMYECFELADLFESAFHNLSSLSGGKGENSNAELVLLLTETSRENGFNRLIAASQHPDTPLCTGTETWYCRSTGEPESVVVQSSKGKQLYVIAGQQIVVAEGLELHALATSAKIDEGQPLDATISKVNQAGAIAALPWGTGKWLGRRGRLIQSKIDKYIRSGVLLSDSGIRPTVWPESSLFRSGAGVIAGTDPLPLSNEASRVGSYGCTLETVWNSNTPSQSIRECLSTSSLSAERMGNRQGFWQFLSRQVAIRL